LLTLLADTTLTRFARIAGLRYLLVIVFVMFAELYVGLRLGVPGDAAETADNIGASESLLRGGFVSGLLHHTCFLLVTLVLFKLFRPVDKNLASLMLVFGLASVPIMMANMLNQFAAVVLLGDADYLTATTISHGREVKKQPTFSRRLPLQRDARWPARIPLQLRTMAARISQHNSAACHDRWPIKVSSQTDLAFRLSRLGCRPA
jgi:hypothetical protein